MTTLDDSSPILATAVVEVPSRWERFEGWLGRRSDGLNPILVKEARQALRSRQFTTTFFLMLAAGWTWSIAGLAILGPAAYYNARGMDMLYVYYIILAAPLVVVIPYFAYSSLAAERQDRTYELVSITALDATRILTGKLGGIAMQMVVYLSALFPCVAFTYLLRGVDIISVVMLITYTCFVSLGLAMCGLLLATLSPPRQRYVILGVLFAVGLCGAFMVLVVSMTGLIMTQGLLLDFDAFWQVNLGLALFYSNAFAIVFLSARAMLMSAAQNRATALRVSLAVAQLSAVAWFTWAILAFDRDFVYGLVVLSTLCWGLAGTMMVGESSVLSSRVRRDLPRRALGRGFLTWLTPGPGTGYVFAMTNMMTMTAAATLAVGVATVGKSALFGGSPPRGLAEAGEVLEMGIVATAYVTIYLGLGRLILSALRRYDDVRLTIRVLVMILLLLIGAGGPWAFQITNPQTRYLDYTLLQTTNPFWTLLEYCEHGTIPSGMGAWLVISLPMAALLIFGLNLPGISRELLQTWQPAPKRVTEEDAEQAAARADSTPSSPWDE